MSGERLTSQITLRQLQIFEAVVRLGGVTRAADALFLSQPTVSMQIRKLSDMLGLELFEQVGRELRLTPAGQEVHARARDILGQVAGLGELAQELKGEVGGELRIAVVTSAKYFMPHLLGAFVARYPRITPRLSVTNRAKVLQRLKSNEDDLLIMGRVPGELAVEAHSFIDNEIVMVAAPGHALAGKSNISLSRLMEERFLVREPGSGTRQAVDRLFERQGLEISPYMELGSSEAIMHGVIAGLGIAALSLRTLSLVLPSGKITILDVQGFPLVRRWYAAHIAGRKLSLAARTFLDFLLEESRDILAGDGA